ncbi:restriction endonuclease subunit S [Clostridium beijerinckii]|uniref:Type I restriction modification DNA specificity domain-containing protein n=1 Tax=Clostridium beijerinckii TaxID=1520 RepID=A0A1S9N3V8_CLOBE|nr:restriction endonuclease subunit S [Clostridium beijerinckii]OOP72122.1 hypothetical protein CBEIBR21_17875 [Clostridium beijerinckii]
MNNELKPYDEYIYIGLTWCDRIPSNWNIKRAKSMFSIIDIRSETGNEELLSVSANHGVIKRKNANVTMFKAESYKGYKLCWKEDLVVNSLWAWQQGLGFSKHHGIISTAYSVYRLNNRYLFNYKYYNYLIRSSDYLWELRVRSKGIWRSRYQLTDQSFMDIPIIVPPKNEQDKIVDYLDFQLAKINKFIKAKKKLIAALKEQKQVVINEAVTKGINQSVKMKSSGIEWLGDIPEHWEIKRAKNYLTQTDKKSNDGTEQLLTVSHITGVTPRSEKNVTMFMAESTEGYKICEKDMIAVNTMWAWMGALGVSNYYGIISPSYHTYRMKYDDIYESEYLDKLLRTSGYIYEYYIRSTGIRSSRLRLYPDKFLEIFFVRPPLEEQRKISQYINQKLEAIDGSIYKIEKEIELITEYRTSLISDVVTGKVDVHNIKIDEVIDEDTENDEIEDAELETEEISENEEE